MLYTPEYQAMQQEMHANKREFGGVQSIVFADRIYNEIVNKGATTVLDYGAGRGHLGEALFALGYRGFYRAYDPAVPWWSSPPEPADYVCCIDVLEHVEPECLEDVLADLRRVIVKHGFISVHSEPAKKTLPDGRNAHLIQQPPEWWLEKMRQCFKVIDWSKLFAKADKEQLLGAVFMVEPLP